MIVLKSTSSILAMPAPTCPDDNNSQMTSRFQWCGRQLNPMAQGIDFHRGWLGSVDHARQLPSGLKRSRCRRHHHQPRAQQRGRHQYGRGSCKSGEIVETLDALGNLGEPSCARTCWSVHKRMRSWTRRHVAPGEPCTFVVVGGPETALPGVAHPRTRQLGLAMRLQI